MKLSDIAYKNVTGSLYKYIMYYLSNALAVTIFFIFANFIFNPSIAEVKNAGSPGLITAQALVMCEFVIVIFSVLFINYSITNFLKSREKEFGLLTLLGMSQSQVRAYIIYENLIVTAASIGTGLFFGIIFSKLFFMAVAVVLDVEGGIPFGLSTKAALLTVGCFAALFQGINLFCVFKMKSRNIVELLKGARIPRPAPRFSVVKSVLAILFLTTGYLLALLTYKSIIATMLPIVISTVLGTYFLFTQFSVLFTRLLQGNRTLFYRGTNMVTLSQMIYKLKDNARVLFIIAISGAVTLTAAGSVYSLQGWLKSSWMLHIPQDISLTVRAEYATDVPDIHKIEEAIERRNAAIQYKSKISLLQAINAEHSSSISESYNDRDLLIMSNSDHNRRAKELQLKPVNLKEEEALVYTYQAYDVKKNVFLDREFLNVKVGSAVNRYKLTEERRVGLINPNQQTLNVLVLQDSQFNKLYEQATESEKWVYYGYNLKRWEDAASVTRELKGTVASGKNQLFFERITQFTPIMTLMNLLLFIGVFIAILFFISTGSIIYFKMFTEIQRDKAEFTSLRKIGMTDGEMARIINTQTAVIFFLPFVVAVVHAAFAVGALEKLLQADLKVYALTVVGIYFACQLIYFVFAKSMYTRQIREM